MKVKVILLAVFIQVCSYSQDLKIAEIGPLQLVNGGVIINCKVAYRTAGMINEDTSNVIVYPTWFGGNSGNIINVGSRLLDTTKYFLIGVDALGNGFSSSASNSPDQADSQFPEITIKDIVNSQYKLLKESLGIEHVFAFLGGSMGAMQVFEWAVSYPDYMDKVIPYAGSPRLTPFDLMLWECEIRAIELWENNGGSREEIAELIGTIHNLLMTTPENKNNQVSRENFNEYLKNIHENYRKIFNPYDWKSQLKAMMHHDISVNGSLDEAADRIKADMLIMVGSRDLIVNPQPAIDFGSRRNFRKHIFENDCGHLAPGCEFDTFKSLINDFLNEKHLN
jgi:homoserine O-acetyltransferase/O-succinyltransferase